MGRKSKPENYPVFLSAENFDRLVNDAPSVARWNPGLAIKLMETAFVKCLSPIQSQAWNKAAVKVNDTIASIQSQFYYNEREYWKDEKFSRLELINEEYTMEDYISLQQFSK